MPGKGGTQWANVLKAVCPSVEGLMKSFKAVVQRGRGQFLGDADTTDLGTTL